MDSIHKKIVRGFAWEAATKACIQLLSWVSTFLVARMLVPEDYGLVAISGIFTGFCLLLSNMGLSAGIVNKKDITVEELDGVFWLSLLLGVSLYVVLFFASDFIGSYYGNSELPKVIRYAGLILIFSSINIVPIAQTMRELDFRFSSLVEMFGQLVTTVATLVLAYHGYGAWSLVYSVLVGQIAIVFPYLVRYSRFPSLRFRFATILPIIRFGATLVSSRLVAFLNQKSATFVVSSMLGERAAGVYFFSSNLAALPITKIGEIFQRVAFPALSSLKRNDADPKVVFLQMHRYLVLIVFPVLIGMALVAPEAVKVLVGDKWLESIPILQVLCVINIFVASGILIPPTLQGLGKAGLTLKFEMLNLVVLPAAMFVGARHGLTTMMYAWCLAYPLLYMLLLYRLVAELQIKWPDFFATCTPAVVSSIAMACAVISVKYFAATMVAQLPLLLLEVAGGGMVYLGVIALCFPREISDVKRVIAKR